MRVITNKRLIDFAASHTDAAVPLQAWRKTMEAGEFRCFADVKRAFGSADKVGDLHVFDIGGNKYRLIAFLHFAKQLCFIKAVLTHRDYDRGEWK